MIKKLLLSSIVLSIFVILAIDQTLPAWSTDTTKQLISTNMDGFAFTPAGCCASVSTELHGNIIAYADGTWSLSQQGGVITLSSTSYNLQFIPTGQLDVQTPKEDCAGGTIYTQNGEITLAGSDGTTFKGSGTYSWGNTLDCSGSAYSFTNLSGKFKDSTGQISNFFTGTDSSPEIQ